MFGSIKIVAALLIISFLGSGYLYVTKLQSDLETARANVAKLDAAVKVSEDSVAMLMKEAEANAERTKELTAQLNKAEEYGDELRATLQKHNLTHLANKKPGMIQKRMQNATDKLWDDLVDITNPNGLLDTTEQGTGDNNSN